MLGKNYASERGAMWLVHYDCIKARFLQDMAENVSEDTYKISWEVLRVFEEYATKYFESLTEETV